MKKYLYRINRMHSLIKKKATGPPEEFAEKMLISKSMLLQNIADMRELGFPITYNRNRKTYNYTIEQFNEPEDNILSGLVLKKIIGGIEEPSQPLASEYFKSLDKFPVYYGL